MRPPLYHFTPRLGHLTPVVFLCSHCPFCFRPPRVRLFLGVFVYVPHPGSTCISQFYFILFLLLFAFDNFCLVPNSRGCLAAANRSISVRARDRTHADGQGRDAGLLDVTQTMYSIIVAPYSEKPGAGLPHRVDQSKTSGHLHFIMHIPISQYPANKHPNTDVTPQPLLP